MAKIDVGQWLQDWVEENIQVPRDCENQSEMAEEAETCRATAEVDGISIKDLNTAAGGDLERYLFRAQKQVTEAYARRNSGEG